MDLWIISPPKKNRGEHKKHLKFHHTNKKMAGRMKLSQNITEL